MINVFSKLSMYNFFYFKDNPGQIKMVRGPSAVTDPYRHRIYRWATTTTYTIKSAAWRRKQNVHFQNIYVNNFI